MAKTATKINVYLEVGKKRTFAGAIDWPGWCRSGRDEESALQALLDSAADYQRAIASARLGFRAPKDTSAFVVKERLKGNATTDFGAPAMAPASDAKPVSAKELQRLQKVLKACWRTFQANVKSSTGKTLQKGPRGGGRQLKGMIEHVLGSNEGYLKSVGWKPPKRNATHLQEQLEQTEETILNALIASARGEIPAKGPRGGQRWSARYFVRRIAWHILDHAWEMEDRTQPS
jgi:hypothetical protein